MKIGIFIFMVIVIVVGTLLLVFAEARKSAKQGYNTRKKLSPITVFFLIILCIIAFLFLFKVFIG